MIADCHPLLPMSDNNGKYIVYPKRWLILAIFCMSTTLAGAFWITFAPIADQASDFFGGIGGTGINMLALVFQILAPPGTYLTSYLINQHGLRYTLVFGGIFMCLGSLLRYIGTLVIVYDGSTALGYALALIGQICCGLVQSCFLNTPAKIATNWFGVDQRDLACTLCCLFNPIGNALGSVLPPLFVSGSNNDVKGMDTLMLAEFIFAFIVLILLVLLFESNPPSPPSAASNSTTNSNSNTIKADAYKILSSWNYILLLMSFGLGLGIFNSFLTIMESIALTYGYTSEDAGNFSAMLIGSGLVGAAASGVLLDKYHVYKPTLKIGFVSSALATLFFCLVMKANNGSIVLISFALMGLFMIPMLPVSIECAVECTWPIPEELSSGILLTAGNILTVPLTFMLASISDSGISLKIAMISTLVVVVTCALLYQGDYKRLKADKCEPETGHSDVQ